MGVKLYHQVGFRHNWSIDSFRDEGCGSGLILSPVHQKRERVVELDEQIRKHSLFDPQFYLPNSPKENLASYSFFPQQLTGGFSTKDFAIVALESASQCVAFQLEQDFEGLVIPARFFDQMVPRYFERQEESTLVPFLTAIERARSQKPVFLTLPVTSAMILEPEFRVQLLNWVTGFPEVGGVYLLVSDDRPTKQIRSEEFLVSYLSFSQELTNAGLKLVLGHLNTEAVLLSVIEEATLTFGAYENTRMFSLDKFIETDEERRAPKARIYLPGLLNWIQYDQAMQIRNADPGLWGVIHYPTHYAEQVISRAADPHFTQPDLYKHHFICMNAQIKKLSKLGVGERYEAIRAAISAAIECYERIEDLHIELDPHGRGTHLQPWLAGLDRFYRRTGRQ